jgi:S-adenosyl methyltransferase
VTVGSVPFDASRPHVARVYDYLLGGKDNFAADRAVGDRMLASIPTVQLGVRAQRDVLGRVVRYLVGQAGLRQLPSCRSRCAPAWAGPWNIGSVITGSVDHWVG